VRPGDLDDRCLCQRDEGTEQEAEGQGAHRSRFAPPAGQGRNIRTTPYFWSASRRWVGGGEKGAARFTAVITAESQRSFPLDLASRARSSCPAGETNTATCAVSRIRSASGMVCDTS